MYGTRFDYMREELTHIDLDDAGSVVYTTSTSLGLHLDNLWTKQK